MNLPSFLLVLFFVWKKTKEPGLHVREVTNHEQKVRVTTASTPQQILGTMKATSSYVLVPHSHS
jgi:hypothetical protein